jgi:acetyltransferase-like isoleucine patch superfamily enzyme
MFRIRGGKYIEIGNKFKAGHLFRLETFPEHSRNTFEETFISIGDGVHCGNNVHIGSVTGVRIDNDVLIGSNITIIDHNHGYAWNDISNESKPSERPLTSKGKIIIEKNVWICDGCIILGGTIIKANSVVPANSVVKGHFQGMSIIKC